MQDLKKDIISRLQKDILFMEGYRPASANSPEITGLQAITAAFPHGIFPTGAIHEFLSAGQEQAAASAGFIAGLLAPLMKKGGVCLWAGIQPLVFPPALTLFGIEPHKVIFIHLQHERGALWVMEEALKCKGLAAVIAEVREINFMQSRRLQLAAESSSVTGFVLQTGPCKPGTTACAARWQVTPVASEPENGMPGVGLPRWQVELLKVRNGKPGNWKVEWAANRFALVTETTDNVPLPKPIRKVS